MGLELGEDQPAVDGHLELAAVRGDQREGLNLGFEGLDQFRCQANGPVGVVSDGTVDDVDR